MRNLLVSRSVLCYNRPMNTVLTFLPASARLYVNVLTGIKRRMRNDFRLQTIDYAADEATLKKLLDFWRPVGCIIVAAEGVPSVSRRTFGAIPVVYLDRTPLVRGDYLDVLQDYDECARTAARELIRPEIDSYGYVGYKNDTNWSKARGAAFANAVSLQGKPCRTFSNAPSHGERLKQLQKWLISLPKPAAVFAANDLTAVEVHTICLHNGIRIPEDVTLVGTDNIPDICESVAPAVSSVCADFEQGGWHSADLLLERIENPKLRRATRLYPVLGLVRRPSTCKRLGAASRVLKSIEIIRARACDGITVEDVAMEMGCTRRMAEIRFRNETGRTIKSIITETRLERARVLLKARDLSFGEVAAACGYGTENALRIAFRKHCRTTLSAYRSAGTSASRKR